MIAKIESIFFKPSNTFDRVLMMHLQRQIEADSYLEIDSIREMVEVFIAENFNAVKYRGCNPSKLKVMTSIDKGTTTVYLMKYFSTYNAHYELMKINFKPESYAIENSV